MAMVRVVWRGVEEGLAATAKATVPLPLPLLPEVICTQPTLLTAVHAQPESAVTLTLPVPPAAGKF